MFHSDNKWAGGSRHMKFIMEIESEHESKAVHFRRQQHNSYRFKFLGFFYVGNITYLTGVVV
jgi:hypothetical protein